MLHLRICVTEGRLVGEDLEPKEWSQWPGLNRRPTVYETVALPLSYIGTHITEKHFPKLRLGDALIVNRERRQMQPVGE